MALAFANAIARPGGGALLIGNDNQGNGWVDIREAVSAGVPYAVEPREGIVAMDVDSAEDRAKAEAIQGALSEQGFRAVTTESGRPGHGHLWLVAPPGWSNKRTADHCRKVVDGGFGHQVRYKQPTRPPYSPHRLGGRSEVVTPDPEIALGWFESVRPKELPEHTERWLTTRRPGDLKSHRKSPSRSLTLHAVACSMVNSRHTYTDFRSRLINAPGLLGQKCREQPNPADYLLVAWESAEKYVRAKPPQSSSEIARAHLEGLRATVDLLDWPARTGQVDRAVYRALIGFGHAGATRDVSAGLRQLADASEISKDTVSRAIGRLRERGLLADVDLPNRGYGFAKVYRLLSLDEKSKPLVRTDNNSLSIGAQSLMLSTEAEGFADIFSGPPGLGPSRRATWEAIPADRFAATSEVMKARVGEAQVSTIREHLNKLRHWGLADRSGNRWKRLEPPVEQRHRIATMLGVRGRLAARSSYHRREVETYQQRFKIAFR